MKRFGKREKVEKADPMHRSGGWEPPPCRRGNDDYDSCATKGVHTYTAEDFGGQVFIKLADDYSYVVVLNKRRREKSNHCDWDERIWTRSAQHVLGAHHYLQN